MAGTTLDESTRQARDDQLPLVHFYRILAADECEQLER